LNPLRQKILLDNDGCEVYRAYEYQSMTSQPKLRLLVEEWDNGKLIKMVFLAHNTNRAEHPEGFWDLGDPNSILIDSIAMQFAYSGEWEDLFYQISPGLPIKKNSGETWYLNQVSSGGVNWDSRNHVDRSGRVPLEFCGYTTVEDGMPCGGLRATPWLAVGDKVSGLAFMAPNFWQRFPQAYKVQGGNLLWEILPEQSYEHELQPGEQIERCLWLEQIEISEPLVSRSQSLRHPLLPRPVVQELLESIPQPLLLASDQVYPTEIENSVRSMFLKSSGFMAKREIVDEFGWRNFGDVWADHEQAYADCTYPIISHYNNQYDLLNGFIHEFLRSGDAVAAELASDLARHVLNIDIYRTNNDRASFNNGLFWHTSHYRDALTSTHRCYSRGMISGRHNVAGGGLANEHMYSQGLTLFYLLTGDARFREVVIDMAERVVLMDDGNYHWMALLSGARTGAASTTATNDYHGPGRGIGNSINTLIDGWCITNDGRYAQKGVELIQRMIHPLDSIESFNFANAELRWSYTVAVQSLQRWLSTMPDIDGIHTYIRHCLIKIGDWMLENETLYLSNRDQLEFPTETWSAQDLRKANCMIAISQLTEGLNSERLCEKGKMLFEDAWSSLQSFDSHKCTRPCAIVLQQLPLRFTNFGLVASITTEKDVVVFPEKRSFLSQRDDIRNQCKSLKGILSMMVRGLTMPWHAVHLFSHSSMGRSYRKVSRQLTELLGRF
jgi:hypothetical protein